MGNNLDYYSIGQQIRKFRKIHGYSQEELAEKVCISTTHMSHIETGNTKLSLNLLVNLAHILDVSVDDILFDHPTADKNIQIEKLQDLLQTCNMQELYIIQDIVKALKTSLSQHM